MLYAAYRNVQAVYCKLITPAKFECVDLAVASQTVNLAIACRCLCKQEMRQDCWNIRHAKQGQKAKCALAKTLHSQTATKTFVPGPVWEPCLNRQERDVGHRQYHPASYKLTMLLVTLGHYGTT